MKQEQKTNGMAVAGLVLAFFIPLVGLILSIIGLRNSKDGRGGKGLAIAGIVISIVVGIAQITLVAGLFSAVDEAVNESSSSATDGNSQPAETVGLGEPARDGKFEFTVSAVNCGETVLGTNEFLQAKAKGEFCVLDLTIQNIGDEPQTLFADNQYVFNDKGQKYSYASDAVGALEDVTDIWLEEINPGNTVKGKLPFDVPKGTKLIEAQLHDSTFSNGVKVKLQ